MGHFIVSILLLAAGQAPAPPAISDAEVLSQLTPIETLEWHGAMRTVKLGENRVRQGQSIMATSFEAAKTSKITSGNKLNESPEQIKLRAQKIIDEGNAQIDLGSPSLNRLRLAAAMRIAEKTKAVDYPISPETISLFTAATRSIETLHKQFVATGYKNVHVLGAFTLTTQGVLDRPASLSDLIRSSWKKVSPDTLLPVPEDGYLYVAPKLDGVAALSKFLSPVKETGQEAVIWAEVYAVTPDAQQGLLFIRMADAHSFKLLASEATFVNLRGGLPPQVKCSLLFNDKNNFIVRLSNSGEWAFGFEKDSHPLGSAIISHFCVSQPNISIAAAPYIVVVIGGGPPVASEVGAKWRIKERGPKSGESGFDVTATPTNGPLVEVGTITINLIPIRK